MNLENKFPWELIVCLVCIKLNLQYSLVLHFFFFNVLQVDECELQNTNIRSRRTWDDDFCLKRQFTALIPAFDPRPGRSNVQQIQDVEVPSEGIGFY